MKIGNRDKFHKEEINGTVCEGTWQENLTLSGGLEKTLLKRWHLNLGLRNA